MIRLRLAMLLLLALPASAQQPDATARELRQMNQREEFRDLRHENDANILRSERDDRLRDWDAQADRAERRRHDDDREDDQ